MTSQLCSDDKLSLRKPSFKKNQHDFKWTYIYSDNDCASGKKSFKNMYYFNSVVTEL